MMIRQMSEQPAADRTHDEADRKQDRCVQLLYDGVVARKKRSGKVKRKCRVDVEVIPLDEIADGTNEDGFQPALYISKAQAVVFYVDRNGSHGQYNTAIRLVITAPCDDAGTVHKRHKMEPQKAQKTLFFVLFVFPFVPFVVRFPISGSRLSSDRLTSAVLRLSRRRLSRTHHPVLGWSRNCPQ